MTESKTKVYQLTRDDVIRAVEEFVIRHKGRNLKSASAAVVIHCEIQGEDESAEATGATATFTFAAKEQEPT